MSVKVEEKSLQLALVKAAGQLGVTQDSLSYKVIEESKGFLGMFGKKICIEAWKKKSSGNGERRNSQANGRGPKKPSNRTPNKSHKNGRKFSDRSENPYRNDRNDRNDHRTERKGRRERDYRSEGNLDERPKVEYTQEEVQTLQADLAKNCKEIVSRMLGYEVPIEFSLDNDRFLINISDEYLEAQIAKNTKLLEALEHILRKVPRAIKQELPFRIFIDVNHSRKDREEELVHMAQDLSNKVSENKKPIVLNYKSSYDRKIIHMALDKDDRVYTKSIGNGSNRKLMILPSQE